MSFFSWEVLFILGAMLLGAAIAYGAFRYYTRDRRNDAITEQATREEYRHPERYDRTEDEFRKQVRPS